MKFSVTQVIILSVTLVGLVSAARSLAGLARKLAENKAETPIPDETNNVRYVSQKTNIWSDNEMASFIADVARISEGGASISRSNNPELFRSEIQAKANLTMANQ